MAIFAKLIIIVIRHGRAAGFPFFGVTRLPICPNLRPRRRQGPERSANHALPPRSWLRGAPPSRTRPWLACVSTWYNLWYMLGNRLPHVSQPSFPARARQAEPYPRARTRVGFNLAASSTATSAGAVDGAALAAI